MRVLAKCRGILVRDSPIFRSHHRRSRQFGRYQRFHDAIPRLDVSGGCNIRLAHFGQLFVYNSAKKRAGGVIIAYQSYGTAYRYAHKSHTQIKLCTSRKKTLANTLCFVYHHAFCKHRGSDEGCAATRDFQNQKQHSIFSRIVIMADSMMLFIFRKQHL